LPSSILQAAATCPEEIDTLASRSQDDNVTVLVWRHTDDQYQLDEHETPVKINITGLNANAYTVRHFRIDSTHSNAHTVWHSLGCPQDPSEEELAAIKKRQGLEELVPAHQSSPVHGSLSLQVLLPLPSVSLLVLKPA
jgi:xylan 1,4-beta-xylosidase